MIAVVAGRRKLAALLEDRLMTAGHEVSWVDPAGGGAVERLVEIGADVVIIEQPLPTVEIEEAVRRLRTNNSLRPAPLLVLTESNDSSIRLSALRAGADDVLSPPWQIEELVLRIERQMSGGSALSNTVLQGDLAKNPLWGVLQYLESSNSTGELDLTTPDGSGRLWVEKGLIASATWDHLRDSEAVLAMLDRTTGRFNFRHLPQAAGGNTRTLSVRKILMEHAWLRDETDRTRDHLPSGGANLRIDNDLPDVIEAEAALPFRLTFKAIERQVDVRPYDLYESLPFAISRLKVTLARLIEAGVVVESEKEVINTRELDLAMVLNVAVETLHEAWIEAGAKGPIPSFLLVADEGAWPALRQVLEQAPASGRSAKALGQLRDRLAVQRGGSVVLGNGNERICLHIQVLTEKTVAQINTVLSISNGAALWLADPASLSLANPVREGLGASPSKIGVLLAEGTIETDHAQAWSDVAPNWQLAEFVPISLLGFLRLLQPPEANE